MNRAPGTSGRPGGVRKTYKTKKKSKTSLVVIIREKKCFCFPIFTHVSCLWQNYLQVLQQFQHIDLIFLNETEGRTLKSGRGEISFFFVFLLAAFGWVNKWMKQMRGGFNYFIVTTLYQNQYPSILPILSRCGLLQYLHHLSFRHSILLSLSYIQERGEISLICVNPKISPN